ncbi:hypothetical protein [Flavobacterium sp. FlaQc-48]|uniref:hypothetical protein n=1 Tax=Flavobacterium sp. FlaQc-48 TaxID=3374181 RepID=UPI003757564C
MKKHLLLSGILLLLLSCGKKEISSGDEKLQNDTLVAQIQSENNGLENAIGGVLFTNTDSIDDSKELDLNLLAKVISQTNIKYADIKRDKTSSVKFNDQITFFVIAYAVENVNKEVGISIERKYVFARTINGKIIAQEDDGNLTYFEDEVVQISKSHIFKKLIRLNETTAGIAFYTRFNAGGGQVQFLKEKLTIVTLDDTKIKKVLYNYTIGRANTSTIDGTTDQTETLVSGLRVSDAQTNGFYDLIISKNFSCEESNMSDDIDVKANAKTKKETEVLKYNGKNYTFDATDKMRFI